MGGGDAESKADAEGTCGDWDCAGDRDAGVEDARVDGVAQPLCDKEALGEGVPSAALAVAQPQNVPVVDAAAESDAENDVLELSVGKGALAVPHAVALPQEVGASDTAADADALEELAAVRLALGLFDTKLVDDARTLIDAHAEEDGDACALAVSD